MEPINSNVSEKVKLCIINNCYPEEKEKKKIEYKKKFLREKSFKNFKKKLYVSYII